MTDERLLGMRLRVPPQNLEAEQALLGALLANNRAFDRLPDAFRPDHFADPVHGRIFAAIARRIGAGQLASATALKSDLEHEGLLEEVGGTRYLAELVGATVGIVNAGEYARVIWHCWMRRELIELGTAIAEAAFGDAEGLDAPQQIEAAEAALHALGDRGATVRRIVGLGDAVGGALAEAEAAAKRGSGLAGITTGYAATDRMTAGMQQGDLVILAARPSMGKTALALAMTARTAAAGVRVLFVSKEMTAQRLAARAASAFAGLDSMTLQFGRVPLRDQNGKITAFRPISEAEWQRLVEAQRQVSALPIVLDDTPGASMSTIRGSARRASRKLGGLDLVVIDYLGLVKPAPEDARKNNRAIEYGGIARDAKDLARSMHIPVLLLSQLNRENERRDDKRPGLADLNWSGDIEAHADVVAFIHRPEYYLTRFPPVRHGNETQERFDERAQQWGEALAASAGLAEINFAKVRNGTTGPTRLRFRADRTWFWDETEWDGEGEPPHPLGQHRPPPPGGA